jgi:hypothetical protein
VCGEDEGIKFHGKDGKLNFSPQEKRFQPAMMACSACGYKLTSGVENCPRCNFRIPAHVYRERKRQASTHRASWMSLGIGVAVVVAVFLVVASVQKVARASLVGDLNSGKLSDAKAFQLRCGNALDVSEENGIKVLTYSRGDLLVKLTPGAPAQFFWIRLVGKDGILQRSEIPVNAQFALGHLKCGQD